MKIKSTYKNLMSIDQDIVQQMNSFASFAIFNREKIKRFKQDNAIRLKILSDTINELMESHVNKDEKKVFKQIAGTGGMPNKWDFKSVEDEAVFKKEIDALLSKEIQIDI